MKCDLANYLLTEDAESAVSQVNSGMCPRKLKSIRCGQLLRGVYDCYTNSGPPCPAQQQ